MDNPSQESNTGALNVNSAADLFSTMLEPPQEEQQQEEAAPAEPEAQAENEAEPVEAQDDQPAEDGEKVTIEVDGKTIELTKQELADAYKNGLRQSDYTKKTMEVAEQRKAATAEQQKAVAERTEYATNLVRMQAQLEGLLQEQQKTDWESLLQNDPVEYLKQQHLFQQRQAAWNQNLQEQQKIADQLRAEQQRAFSNHLAEQQEALLAKLPEWKDEAKAKADKEAIKDYLRSQGFEDSQINQISDARAVLMSRKAMLYDQMVAKAAAAAKKVQSAPQRVVKPGQGEAPRIDGRTSAMQRLGKSGRVEDAAAVFATIL